MFFSATPVVELISKTTQDRLLTAWGDMARLYRRNHLSACVFMCVSAYCLQPTKAVHEDIQGMEKRAAFKKRLVIFIEH